MAINRPDEVAILIAPPLTEDEYRARIPSSDWLGPHGETEQIRDKYWNGVYSPFIAQPLLELINKAQPLGARLIEASLPAVEVATAERPIVVVMAHWKDSEVHIEDLRKGFPPAAWLERAGRHPSPLARWIAPRLAGEKRGGNRGRAAPIALRSAAGEEPRRFGDRCTRERHNHRGEPPPGA